MNKSETKRARIGWAMYDFANSPFPSLMITAFYPLYFKHVMAQGRSDGDLLWGSAVSLSMAVVFILSPLGGALADISGGKKLFMQILTWMCAAATAALVLPGPGAVWAAFALIVAANVGAEGALPFYNAYLPLLADRKSMGRLSGDAWALGYLSFPLALACIYPLASGGLGPDNASKAGLVPLVVAAWILVFSIPTFVLLPSCRSGRSREKDKSVLSVAFSRLVLTIKNIRTNRALWGFLPSYFFFTNAVSAVITFTAIFASDTLGFTLKENLLLLLVMNIVAAPGAFVFGRAADRFGLVKMLFVCLFLWLAVCAGAAMADTKLFFWIVAFVASLILGATQALSRALMGKLSPGGRETEMFGFMTFAGKGSSILGPVTFGAVSTLFSSQRAAVLITGVFFLAGIVLLKRVNLNTETNSSGRGTR